MARTSGCAFSVDVTPIFAEENTQMAGDLEKCCADFRQYMEGVALPAFNEIKSGARTKTLRLHQVFSGNFFVAHAVDYIHAIRKADGIEEGRAALVGKFDQLFNVGGSRLQNGVRFTYSDVPTDLAARTG